MVMIMRHVRSFDILVTPDMLGSSVSMGGELTNISELTIIFRLFILVLKRNWISTIGYFLDDSFKCQHMIIASFVLSGQSKNIGIFIAGFPPRAFGHHIVIDSGNSIDIIIFIFDITSNPLSFVMLDDAQIFFVGSSIDRTK